jgi:hypothetical protein
MTIRVVDVRKSAYTKYIGRPRSGDPWQFGNPFKVGRDGGPGECSPKFEAWLRTSNTFGCPDATDARRAWILDHLPDLKDQTLGCWCNGAPHCHGHVLARLAQETIRNSPDF